MFIIASKLVRWLQIVFITWAVQKCAHKKDVKIL